MASGEMAGVNSRIHKRKHSRRVISPGQDLLKMVKRRVCRACKVQGARLPHECKSVACCRHLGVAAKRKLHEVCKLRGMEGVTGGRPKFKGNEAWEGQ